MTGLKWIGVIVSVYLGIAFLCSAYKRAEDINNNKSTSAGDYFVGLLWPLVVLFIPGYLVDSTAKVIAKYIGWREKKAYAKKFNKVS